MNRRLTSGLASLHFAPTPQARANLLREGFADRDIVVTGNTVVDALRLVVDETKKAQTNDAESVLVTVHRRENHGPALERICEGILALLARRPALTVDLPMHPSPRVRAVVVARLGNHPRIRLGEPLGYRAFVNALHRTTLVLTDSGGVQEECAALGKPVLILRDETERREVLDEGVAELVGTDAQAIARTAYELLADPVRYARMARATPVFGEGHAADLIVEALVRRHQTAAPSSPRMREIAG
jgi:UDP-N-acetylglucosamine 2-epimerase (non-hydrolysing)